MLDPPLFCVQKIVQFGEKRRRAPIGASETVFAPIAHLDDVLLSGVGSFLRLFRMLMDERFDAVKFSDPAVTQCGADISVVSDGFPLSQNEYAGRIDFGAPG